MKLQISNKTLKEDAKYNLTGSHSKAALLMLTYNAVVLLPVALLELSENYFGLYLFLSALTWPGIVFMNLGVRSTMVSFSRGKIPLVSDLFSVGSLYWKELLLQLFLTFVPALGGQMYSFMSSIYVYYEMWLALVIITLLALALCGGWVILTFQWSLAPYLLLDNPSLSVPKLLKISRLLMKGNFWKLISLYLSLIGWFLLSRIPIVGLFVGPIIFVTLACFYNEIVKAYKKSWQAAQEPVEEPRAEVIPEQE